MLRYYTIDNDYAFIWYTDNRDLLILDQYGYWADFEGLRREIADSTVPMIYVPIELCRR